MYSLVFVYITVSFHYCVVDAFHTVCLHFLIGASQFGLYLTTECVVAAANSQESKDKDGAGKLK